MMKFYSNTLCRTLDNGMQIFLLPLNGSSVEVRCNVRTGSIHEGIYLGYGLSHFLEHMLFQGCAGYPGTAAADTLDRLGGKANAYTSMDHTSYYVKIAPEHLAAAVDVIGSMVSAPEFPEERFRKEREVILREREMTYDNPDARLFEESMRLTFLRDPKRHPVIGCRELIAKVDRGIMCDYYRKRYTPDRIFWVIAGCFDPEQAFELVAAKMSGMPRAFLQEAELPQEAEQFLLRECDFDMADESSRLLLNCRPGGNGRPEQLPAWDILSGILGMGDSSILVRHLERETQLAASVRSSCFWWQNSIILSIAARCREKQLVPLEKELRKTLSEIRNGKIPPEAVEREKIQQYSSTLSQLRDVSCVAGNLVANILWSGSPAFGDSYLGRLEAVSTEDVRRAAESLREESFSIVRQHGSARAKKQKPVSVMPERKAEHFLLDSGSRAVLIADHTLPLANFSMLLPMGSIFETPEYAGCSTLISQLLLSGSGKMNEEKILSSFEDLGADVSVNAGSNSFMIDVEVPKKNLRKMLRLLVRVLENANFNSRAFERESQNLRLSLRTAAMNVQSAAKLELRKHIYGVHPYRYAPVCSEEQLSKLSPEKLREFYAGSFCAAQIIYGFAGDVTGSEAQSFARELDLHLSRPLLCRERVPFPQLPGTAGKSELAIAREQTVVALGLPAPELFGRNQLFTSILQFSENHLSSALYKKIREENALSYHAGMSLSGGFHPGMFCFFAITSPENRSKASALLREEIARLRECGITGEEFANARQGAIQQARQQFDNVASLLTGVMLDLHYGKTQCDTFSFAAELEKLSWEETLPVFRKWFSSPACWEVHAGKLQ